MRILIADDEPKVRYALRLLLEQSPEHEIIGEAPNTDSLLAFTRSSCPNVLLLDWRLPGIPGAELLPLLRSICPKSKIVVISGWMEARHAASAAGADAFVSKTEPPNKLLEIIHHGVL
jgi:DNA-binding NarL/FixJ family response regulator